MANQESNQNLVVNTFLGSARSTGFWSVIAGVVGVVASVAGIVLVLTIDELRNFGIAVLIIGLVSLFVALVLSPRAVAMFMVGRQGRYGTNIIVMTVAFFAIVVLLNFLLFRTSNRFDVTATRVFSLSPQTEQILDSLDRPVRANAFFIPDNSTTAFAEQQAEDLLNEFSRQNPNFTYRFVDPELDRSVAAQYDVQDYPTVVFEDIDQGSLQGVFGLNEQDFVTGILIATGIQQKRVYFLTGHKEASITRSPTTGETDAKGFDFAIQGMQRDNYDVRPLNLLEQPDGVPSDAAVVVIPGPEQDLSTNDLDALMDYMLDGGSIIMLLDPQLPSTYRQFINQWGLQIFDDSVADVVSNVAGEALTPMFQRTNGQFAPNSLTGVPIVDELDVVFFPGATALGMLVPPEDFPQFITYTPLALTTPASWLENNPDQVEYDPGLDPSGPMDVVAVIQAAATIDGDLLIRNEDKLAKLIVFTDSDFARNGFFFSSDNADFFLNSVNWLADDTELISIRPKLVPFRELVVNQRERNFIKWSSWFVPPLIMLILSTIVWWRRR
ncbi:MAG: Gldg family protein [SAR202 cluster bacterium]|nr:Gldg family protein [SAR202 cluster bacterium]